MPSRLALIVLIAGHALAEPDRSYSVMGKVTLEVEAPPPQPPAPPPVVKRAAPSKREHVFFDSGSVAATAESREALDGVARELLANPSIQLIRIEGHSDAVERSVALSLRRAEWVRDYLVKKGVTRERLQAEGFGAARPASKDDAELNRRAEFVVAMTVTARTKSPAR